VVVPLRPQLRALETIPVGDGEEILFAMRDPQGFAPMVFVPYGAALLASLMDGTHTLAQIQDEFKREVGEPVSLIDLKRLIGQLDEAYLLQSRRFAAHYRREVDKYLSNPVRPAAHAGEHCLGTERSVSLGTWNGNRNLATTGKA